MTEIEQSEEEVTTVDCSKPAILCKMHRILFGLSDIVFNKGFFGPDPPGLLLSGLYGTREQLQADDNGRSAPFIAEAIDLTRSAR